MEEPLAVIAFHYHPSASYEPELIASALPNTAPEEQRRLWEEYGVAPQGMRDVVVLTLQGHVLELRQRHPCAQVHGIQFALRELGMSGLRLLLGLKKGQSTLYSRQVEALLQRMVRDREELTFANLVRCVEEQGFRDDILGLVVARLNLARPWIDDRRSVRALVKPGRLLVVDLRGEWLPEEYSHLLMALLGHALILRPPEGGQAREKTLVVFDEYHRYAKSSALAPMIEGMVRERRHLNLNPVLVTQDPTSVPPDLLPQLDGIGLLRHDSEEWNRYLAKHVRAFRKVRGGLTNLLERGEMLWYMKSWLGLDADVPGGSILPVRLRPRRSMHGGATPAAVRREEAWEDEAEERPDGSLEAFERWFFNEAWTG